MEYNIPIYIFIFVIGLVFGSFYNVIGYRLPKKQSIAFPSSHCPNCNHKLKFYENIPIISYMFLFGKCKKCKKKISIIYPLFELITAILFLLSYISFGFSFEFVEAVIIVSILIIISISDLRYYIISDEVLIVGIILLILTRIIEVLVVKGSFVHIVLVPILHGLGSFALMYLIKVLGDFLFKKESLGGGDIKLLGFIGLSIGFEMSIVAIFISSFIALPMAMITLIKKDSNILPYGPFLALSSVIILLGKLDLNMVINFLTK